MAADSYSSEILNHTKLIIRILSFVFLLYLNDYTHGYNEDIRSSLLDITLNGPYHKSFPEKDVTYQQVRDNAME